MRFLSLCLLLVTSAVLAQPATGSLLFSKVGDAGKLTPVFMPPPAAPSVFGMDSAGVLKSLPLGDGLDIVDGNLVITATATSWGDIEGTLTDQADLAAALAARQPLNGGLTAISLLNTQVYGRSLLEAANAGAARTLLGLGSLATLSTVGSSEVTDGSLVDADISSGAAIDMAKISGLNAALSAKLAAASNLSDLSSAATARTNLGLGSLATQSTVGSSDITDGSIVNADISSGAAIGVAKISGTQAARLWGTDSGSTTGTEINLNYINSPFSVFGGSLNFNIANALQALSGVRGAIPMRSSVSWGVITPGTSGYALVSNGSGADPSYQAVVLPSGTLALGGFGSITGTLPIANGGTGQTTASAARLALLPAVSGNGGKILAVNGAASDYALSPTTIDASGNLRVNGTAGFSTPMLRLGADDTGFASVGSNRIDIVTEGQQMISITKFSWISLYATQGLATPRIALSSDDPAAAAWLQQGAGSPEGVVTANKGSLYLRTDGGSGTTLYVKESGTGNTGWVAK